MSTNFYFNNFPQHQVTSEQLLVEDLVIEAMQIHGMDVYYMPRTSRDSVDQLFGDDPLKQYRTAISIEMYLENVTGMDGEGDFISKFGLEIRDELTLLVSRRRFKSSVPDLIRPREGDLIYIPLIKNFFEISFVEHENDQAMYYTLGRGRGGNVYVYSLKLKQFTFSQEIVSTGIREIDDQIFDSYKRTKIVVANTGGTGTFISGEEVYQGANLAYATAQAVVYSWEPQTSLHVVRLIGSFAPGANIIGNTSGAIYNVSSEDTSTQVNSNLFEDIADNIIIENEADAIIDFSEHNPFGEP